MSVERILPCAMIVLSAAASAVYACGGNLRQTVYWAAAAIITASVTF